MGKLAFDSTERFSNRVADYIRFRPSYPSPVLQTLRDECGLQMGHVIADIGSGTGLLSELFLRGGNIVWGIEPNREMRDAGEKQLIEYSNFRSIDGTAESTTLDNASVDFVTAGQAFHWFDREKSQIEFKRILKPQGWAALVWNERRTDSTPFLRDYENLLHVFGTDYQQVNHTQIDEPILSQFFGDSGFSTRSFSSSQSFDFAALRGRLLSSSYAPAEDDARCAPMLDELKRIFKRHQVDGKVSFDYDTNLHYGRL